MARRRRRGTQTQTSLGLPSTPASPVLAPGSPLAPQPLNQYVSSSPPVDPAFEAYRVAANRNTALDQAYGQYQLGGIENQYGLGSDISNPFSRAKLLEENYRRSQRGTLNSYAGMGQLYSGAYERARGENDRNYQIGYDQLARSYSDAKANVGYGTLRSYANNAAGVDESQFQALLRALRGS